jgi:hypothetical protein
MPSRRRSRTAGWTWPSATCRDWRAPKALPILQERYVVLLRQGHPLAGALRDRAALERLDFVLVVSHAEPARALHLLGLQRASG